MSPVRCIDFNTALFFLMGAVFVFCTCSANAAWLQPEGHGFMANSFSSYVSNHFTDAAGIETSQPTYRKYEYNPYLEYGMSDKTTIGVNLQLQRLEGRNAAGEDSSNYALNDTELFFRRMLWQGKKATLSYQPLVKLPSLYLRNNNPRSGTENADAEMRLLGGISFDAFGRTSYAVFEPAYRKRFGKWGDQLRFDATLGFSATDRLTIMPQLFMTASATSLESGSSYSGAVQDYTLLKGQLSAVYRLNEKTRVQAGVSKHMYERNTGDGDGVIFSVWRNF